MATYKLKEINDKEKRFVQQYLIDFNKCRAARRCGVPEISVTHYGRNILAKPHVKKYLEDILKRYEITAEETTKHITDIAKANLADYFITRQVEYTPRVQIKLKDYIKRFKDELSFEQEFSDYANLNGKVRRAQEAKILELETLILRLEMELERNPKATRIVNGETVLIDKAELDVVALVRDKEGGRIKSVKPTEFGLAVEMYAADGALFNLAKMQGLYAKDNAQLAKNQTTIIDWTGKHVGGNNNPDAETT